MKADTEQVLLIIGPMGTGKGVAADFFQKEYGFSVFTFSKLVIDTTIASGLNLTRGNCIKTYDQLRREYGNEIIVKKGIERAVAEGAQKIVFDGCRSQDEVLYIQKEYPSITTLYIESSPETRKKRIKERGRDIDLVDEYELNSALSRDLRDVEPCKNLPEVIIVENKASLKKFYEKLRRFV